MKRLLVVCLLWSCYSSVMAQSNNDWDFLKYVESDSSVIKQICSDTTLNSSDCFEFYIVYKHKPVYSPTEQKWNWIPYLSDSAFVRGSTEYLVQCIVRDTALSYMEDLFSVYLCNSNFDRDFIYESVEWIIPHFLAKEAIEIALLSNYNRYVKTKDPSYLIPYFYYSMYEYIVLGKSVVLSNFLALDDLFMQTTYSTEYDLFRTTIDAFSPVQLARLTSSQRENLMAIIRKGAEKHDLRCEMAYSFLILIGQLHDDSNKEQAVRFLRQYLHPDAGISVDEIVRFCNRKSLL